MGSCNNSRPLPSRLLWPVVLFAIPLSLLVVTDVLLQGSLWAPPLSRSGTTRDDGLEAVRPGLLYELRLTGTYASNKTFVRVPVTDLMALAGRPVRAVLMYDYGPCFWVANGTVVSGRTGGEFVWCSSIVGQLLDAGRAVYVTNTSRLAKRLVAGAHARGNPIVTIAHWGWQEIAVSAHKSGKNAPVRAIGADCVLKMNYWGTMEPTEVWPGDLKRYISLYPLESERRVGADKKDREQTWSCGERGKKSGGAATAVVTATAATVRSSQQTAGVNTGVGLGDQFTRCASDLGSGGGGGSGGGEHLAALRARVQGSAVDAQLWRMVRAQLPPGSAWLQVGSGGSNTSTGGAGALRRKHAAAVAMAMAGPPPAPSAYYVIYGKWGVVKGMDPAKKVSPIFKNESLWEALGRKKLRGVVLTCDKSLAATLRAPGEPHWLCLEADSVFKRPPFYHLLLASAALLLGVGAPYLSTTPFEAMACGTPAVLPAGQHNFLDKCGGGGGTAGGGGSDLFHSVRSADEALRAVDAAVARQRAGTGTSSSSGAGIGSGVAGIFAGMKRDFVDLLDEVEGACKRSVHDGGGANTNTSATPRARRRDPLPQRTSVVSYLITSLMGLGKKRVADDDV